MIKLTVVMFVACVGSAHAANLVQNPSFNANIVGWTPVTSGGTVTWEGGFGNPAGSMYTSAPVPNTSALVTQCVAISAPANVDFIVDGFSGASTGSGDYRTTATMFASPTCSGPNLGNLPDGSTSFPGTGWSGAHIALLNATLTAGTQTVLITIGSFTGAAAGSTANYYFDNIRFGPAGTTPVALQSFNVD